MVKVGINGFGQKGKPDEKDGRKERRKEEKEREIRTREMNERKE